MDSYWENRFKNEGVLWGAEASESAYYTLDLFKKNSIKDILIPGFGYGRNAKLFIDNDITVTGIEISKSAIKLAQKELSLETTIHHGSVNNMPYDNKLYTGVFCYALIHLFNSADRGKFIKHCFHQLDKNGFMVFTVITKENEIYRQGQRIEKNRCQLENGLKLFFYDNESIKKEFNDFGLTNTFDIDEPIKYIENQPPLKLKIIVCRK